MPHRIIQDCNTTHCFGGESIPFHESHSSRFCSYRAKGDKTTVISGAVRLLACSRRDMSAREMCYRCQRRHANLQQVYNCAWINSCFVEANNMTVEKWANKANIFISCCLREVNTSQWVLLFWPMTGPVIVWFAIFWLKRDYTWTNILIKYSNGWHVHREFLKGTWLFWT